MMLFSVGNYTDAATAAQEALNLAPNDLKYNELAANPAVHLVCRIRRISVLILSLRSSLSSIPQAL